MVLVRSLLIILSLASASAYAAVPCDDLLSFASSAMSEETKDLSPSARSYVNLIKLYIDKSNGELDETTASAILNAKSFINPFIIRKDSASTQLAKAIKTLESKISTKDWVQVKSSIKKLIDKSKAEMSDRLDKEQDTSVTLKPKATKIENLAIIHRPTTNIQIHNGRMFSAFSMTESGKQYLFIHEIIDGGSKSRLIGQVETIADKFSFQVIKDKLYVTTSTKEYFLKLYEVDSDEVKFLSEVKTSDLFYRVSWQVIGERVFFAIGSGSLIVYEVVDNKIIERAKASGAEAQIDLRPSWRVIGDRVYIVVGTYSHSLRLYELLENKLELVDSHSTANGSVSSTPIWQSIGGREYLAFLDLRNLEIIEFTSNKLKDSQLIESWSVGSRELTLFTHNEQNILVRQIQGGLGFFSFDGKSIVLVSTLKFNSWLSSITKKLAPDGNEYLFVEDNNGDVYLVAVFGKIEKKGRH